MSRGSGHRIRAPSYCRKGCRDSDGNTPLLLGHKCPSRKRKRALTVTDTPSQQTQPVITALSVTDIPSQQTQPVIAALSVTDIPSQQTQPVIAALSVTDTLSQQTQSVTTASLSMAVCSGLAAAQVGIFSIPANPHPGSSSVPSIDLSMDLSSLLDFAGDPCAVDNPLLAPTFSSDMNFDFCSSSFGTSLPSSSSSDIFTQPNVIDPDLLAVNYPSGLSSECLPSSELLTIADMAIGAPVQPTYLGFNFESNGDCFMHAASRPSTLATANQLTSTVNPVLDGLTPMSMPPCNGTAEAVQVDVYAACYDEAEHPHPFSDLDSTDIVSTSVIANADGATMSSASPPKDSDHQQELGLATADGGENAACNKDLEESGSEDEATVNEKWEYVENWRKRTRVHSKLLRSVRKLFRKIDQRTRPMLLIYIAREESICSQNGATCVLMSENLARYIADSDHPDIVQTLHGIARAAVASKLTNRQSIIDLNASVYVAQQERARAETELRRKDSELADSKRKQAELQAQLDHALLATKDA